MHPRFGFGAGQAGGNDFPHVESDGPWSLEKTISGRQATAVDGNGNDGHFQQGVKPRKDRTSVVYGKSVSVRVDLGGRRIIKKKNIYIIRGYNRDLQSAK